MSGSLDFEDPPGNFAIDRPRGRRRMEECDRCGDTFMEGFRWSGLGIPLALCKACAEDIEESVASYGERGAAAERRLLSLLRGIGADGRVRHHRRP